MDPNHVTDFKAGIAHRRISVFDARIGQKAMHIQLFKADNYEPHLVETVIRAIFHDPNVTDFIDYYTCE